MVVCLNSRCPALESIFRSPAQIITLDANLLIPPYRSIAKRGFTFSAYRSIWLDPLFSSFPHLAIHEAVLEELVNNSTRSYVQSMLDSSSPRLIIHADSHLTDVERVLRDSIMDKIARLTKYDPALDNRDDRGEVKTLAYIAVKGLPYFASHDSNAILLVEKAQEWETGLDNIQAVRMYELLYYLLKANAAEHESLRMLYKYLYYLTERDKLLNPGWSEFVHGMEALYR